MIFPHARYNEILQDTFDKVVKLGTVKGGEYAGDQDRLANFRRNGAQVGVIPEQAWAIYYNKHHDAVMQYIQDLAKGKSRPRAESISGRIDDMITYLLLMKCFVEEHDQAAKLAEPPESAKQLAKRAVGNGALSEDEAQRWLGDGALRPQPSALGGKGRPGEGIFPKHGDGSVRFPYTRPQG